jgi:hypothetical protein
MGPRRWSSEQIAIRRRDHQPTGGGPRRRILTPRSRLAAAIVELRRPIVIHGRSVAVRALWSLSSPSASSIESARTSAAVSTSVCSSSGPITAIPSAAARSISRRCARCRRRRTGALRATRCGGACPPLTGPCELAAQAGRERRRCAERVRRQKVQLQVLADALERAERCGDRLAAVAQCAVHIERQVLDAEVLAIRHGYVYGQRTTITGQWAWCATRSAVEPRR